MRHCFYHDDLDGHCAGAIVKLKYPDTIMYPINYGYHSDLIHDNVDGGDEVFIVDFTLSPSDFQSLIGYAKEVTWIDHHEPKFKMYDDVFNLGGQVPHKDWHKVKGIREHGKAGCELTWEYLHEHEPMPLAVYYTGRWDVWDHRNNNTIPFNRGMSICDTNPKDPESLEFWAELFKNDRSGGNRNLNALDQVIQFGLIAEKMKAEYDRFIGRNAYYVPNWEGYRTVALNSSVFDSYCIFEHDEKFMPFDPEVLIWYTQIPNGKWKYSIRAYPGTYTNVNEIAQKFGGNGHVTSSGFVTDECVIKPVLKSTKWWLIPGMIVRNNGNS